MRVRAKVLTTAGVVAREIGIANGRVTALEPLGSDLQGDDTITLADDEALIPGLVDAHVHVNEPGRTDWEGFSSATKAVAAGGVTTILEMPLNSIPSTVNGPALELKQYVAASQAFADVGFWGGLFLATGSTSASSTTPASSVSSAFCCTQGSTSSLRRTLTSLRTTCTCSAPTTH